MHKLHRAMSGSALALVMATLPVFLGIHASAQGVKPIPAAEVKYRKRLFRNEQVSVFLLDIPPHHASVMHRHDTDLLTIFFEGGRTRGTIYAQPPKEDNFRVGDVRFRPPGFTHLTENNGNTDFRAVILEFGSPTGPVKTSTPSSTHRCDAAESGCVDEKYVLCTSKFCVLDVSVAPGALWSNDLPGKGILIVAILPFELSRKRKGESAKSTKLRSGEVKYVPIDQPSDWKNVAKVPTRFMAILFAPDLE